jgi:hypothetical protein
MSARKTYERARKAKDKSSSEFTSWAIEHGYGRVRFNDLAAAIKEPEGLSLLNASNRALVALRLAEQAAVSEGRAWRGTFGLLFWY